MIEFAPMEPADRINEIYNAWVVLFDNHNFTGESVILDYADRDLRDYDDFDKIDDWLYDIDPSGNPLRGEVTSLIYGIPLGHKLRLYTGYSQEGAYFDLIGTGTVERIVDLRNAKMSDGTVANDRFRSAEWDALQSPQVWVDFNFFGEMQDGTRFPVEG